MLRNVLSHAPRAFAFSLALAALAACQTAAPPQPTKILIASVQIPGHTFAITGPCADQR